MSTHVGDFASSLAELRRRHGGVNRFAVILRIRSVYRRMTDRGVTVDYLSYDSPVFKQFRRRHPEFRDFVEVRVDPNDVETAYVECPFDRAFFEVQVRRVDRPYAHGLTQAEHRQRVKSATGARRRLLRGKPLPTT